MVKKPFIAKTTMWLLVHKEETPLPQATIMVCLSGCSVNIKGKLPFKDNPPCSTTLGDSIPYLDTNVVLSSRGKANAYVLFNFTMSPNMLPLSQQVSRLVDNMALHNVTLLLC